MVTWQDAVLAGLAFSLVAWGGVRLYWFIFDRPSKEAILELRRRRDEAKVRRAFETLEAYEREREEYMRKWAASEHAHLTADGDVSAESLALAFGALGVEAGEDGAPVAGPPVDPAKLAQTEEALVAEKALKDLASGGVIDAPADATVAAERTDDDEAEAIVAEADAELAEAGEDDVPEETFDDEAPSAEDGDLDLPEMPVLDADWEPPADFIATGGPPEDVSSKPPNWTDEQWAYYGESWLRTHADEQAATVVPVPGSGTPSGLPIPDSGLPPGWTEEQWHHYGHIWMGGQQAASDD